MALLLRPLMFLVGAQALLSSPLPFLLRPLVFLVGALALLFWQRRNPAAMVIVKAQPTLFDPLLKARPKSNTQARLRQPQALIGGS